MSEQKRKYNKIAPEHLKYAKARFAEFASTSAVRAELKAKGGSYEHPALHYYWTLANPKNPKLRLTRATKALPYDDPILMAEINNADPGDECVCDETSSRNCGVHQNGGGC